MVLAGEIPGKNCRFAISTVPCSCLCPGDSAGSLSYILQAMPVLSPALFYIALSRKGHEHFHLSTGFALPNGKAIREHGC